MNGYEPLILVPPDLLQEHLSNGVRWEGRGGARGLDAMSRRMQNVGF